MGTAVGAAIIAIVVDYQIDCGDIDQQIAAGVVIVRPCRVVMVILLLFSSLFVDVMCCERKGRMNNLSNKQPSTTINNQQQQHFSNTIDQCMYYLISSCILIH